MGSAPGDAGGLRLTSRFVERDGSPWFPVMGEYHFSRDLPERWEQELRKMRAGGVTVVATYMLWIVHEERRGTVRWDGQRDLRRFVELADAVGLKVMLRIGPWAHGETRNGGFPDWLQAMDIVHRSNDPAYLELARGWYSAVASQVHDLFHGADAPDAPIIAIQVDNELYDQPEHLRTLREIAEDVGMPATLWVATGWGGAQLPTGAVLPVYAGYSDGFWEEATTGWPDFGIMHFTFTTVRDDLSVGADLRDDGGAVAPAGSGVGADEDPWPFATCELGGGMQVAYHRRPLVDSDDVAALALTKLGSGSGWQGYYLYHGATQVLGELSTTQESHETGYPNDVPIRDYDFHAPIGAEGQQRRHFHQLRRQHLLLDAFGASLAAAPTLLPEPGDDVRWAVRADARAGFLFFNNHQPAIAALPPIAGVAFTVRFDEREVTLPSVPFEMPSGAFAAWPLRQPLGSVPAASISAQPVTSFDGPDGPVVLLAATPGVPVELQLEGVAADEVRGGDVREEAGVVIVTPTLEPGLRCEVRVGDTTFVVLDADTADAVWCGRIAGRESVVIWSGAGWFDDDGFVVAQTEDGGILHAYPALEHVAPAPSASSILSAHVVAGSPVATPLAAPVFDVRAVAPRRTGGSQERLSAPDDGDFAALAPVAVPIDDALFDDVDRLLLRLEWVGDAVRVLAGDLLIADQFWHGRALEVDLVPHRARIRESGLWLQAFAWSPDSEVYVDPRVRPVGDGPLLEVRTATTHAVRHRTLA